ncbi:MAG: FkbM family methyltransferase [Parvibaculum sp.]|nr:FkbM family methyltransferase [Parvibaculum sp.]
MLSQLKRAVISVLPRVFVAQYRHKRHVDEVAMMAALCGRGGVMVDVGAHHGGSTEQFLALGWKVIAYEPDPNNRAKFIEAHGSNPSVQWSPDAISLKDGEKVQLFASDVSTGISGLSAFHPSHEPLAIVNTVRLDADLKRRGVEKVDFLKIDVEGFDFFALQSFDWALHPRFAVYEFENNKTVPLGYTLDDSAAFMRGQGYHLLYSVWEPIVRYGTSHTWRGLYGDPPADAAVCWGNVMCFRDHADMGRAEKLFAKR